MPRIVACLLAAVAAAALAQPARAAVIVADFREELNLPDSRGGQPRVLERLGVDVTVTPAPQLTGANEISNPDGWSNGLDVSFDPVTNVLSLTGDGYNIYQIITVTLSGLTFDIAGQQVVGFAPISTGNAVFGGSAVPGITTSFTATSVTITYAVPLGNGDVFEIDTGTDTFQLTLGGAAAVPEPASLALVVVGLPAVAAARRFRRRAAG